MKLRKNDIINLTIESLTNEGTGLGRYENPDDIITDTTGNEKKQGFVVFVPFSAVGDNLKVKILKVLASHAYGRIEEIITASNDRIKSDCNVFTKCGGCDFRHIDYQSELKAKMSFIKDAFDRIGKLTPDYLPMIPNKNSGDYRNKAQYPIGKNFDGEIFYGFYRTNSHEIVPCAECKIQPAIFKEIMDFIIEYAGKTKISVYNEKEHQGVLRHICIRKGHYTEQVLVTVVARRKIPEFTGLAKKLRSRFPQIKGVVLNINKEITNVILGKDESIIDGELFIYDKMCGLDVRISSKSFYQINTAAAEELYRIVKTFCEPKDKVILDLYSGIGTIGLSMADEASGITGIEIVPEAVENAVFNASANNIPNADFICGDTGKALQSLLEKGFKPDAVILDPARKGCESGALKDISALSPERIVMVSCNPATAARDCRELSLLGYKAVKVQGVDMFSRTTHVECVILLRKT